MTEVKLTNPTLLSDNDPSHSEVAVVKQRLDGGKAKDKGPVAGDRRQAMASSEPESSRVGGDVARHDREVKQARKEPNKKQTKPQAAASSEASTVLTAAERQNPFSSTRVLFIIFLWRILYFSLHIHSPIIRVIIYFERIIINIIV